MLMFGRTRDSADVVVLMEWIDDETARTVLSKST